MGWSAEFWLRKLFWRKSVSSSAIKCIWFSRTWYSSLRIHISQGSCLTPYSCLWFSLDEVSLWLPDVRNKPLKPSSPCCVITLLSTVCVVCMSVYVYIFPLMHVSQWPFISRSELKNIWKNVVLNLTLCFSFLSFYYILYNRYYIYLLYNRYRISII